MLRLGAQAREGVRGGVGVLEGESRRRIVGDDGAHRLQPAWLHSASRLATTS